MDMSMTHYMQLLSTNQPWNLLIYMALPVIFAEFIAVSELFILLRKGKMGRLKIANRVVGTAAGVYFLGIFVYLLFDAVVPITANAEWRGAGDVIAVGFYLLGVVPLLGLTILEFAKRNKDNHDYQRMHTGFVALFLVVAHVAMIFGMLDPKILMPM